MRCERCHNNQARLTVTLNTKDGPRQAHLCPTCALSLPVFYAPAKPSVRADTTCSVCGLSLSEFAAGGKFGCSHCYETFALDLHDVLTRVQGTDHHIRPQASSESAAETEQSPVETEVTATRPELDALKRSLREAIEAEDYLQAAALRDEIRAKEGDA